MSSVAHEENISNYEVEEQKSGLSIPLDLPLIPRLQPIREETSAPKTYVDEVKEKRCPLNQTNRALPAHCTVAKSRPLPQPVDQSEATPLMQPVAKSSIIQRRKRLRVSSASVANLRESFAKLSADAEGSSIPATPDPETTSTPNVAGGTYPQPGPASSY